MTVLERTTPLRSGTEGGAVLLRHVSWKGYCALLEEVGDDAVRMTYDDGLLEIEVPSESHERLKSFVADIIVTSLKRLRLPFQPLGSATWKRKERLKGIEADECYYIQSVDKIRGKVRLDLDTDPPPDLAVEAEQSRTSLDKLRVYGALGVPEVWRVLENGDVQFLQLNPSGDYDPIPASLAIPFLTSEAVQRYTRQLPPGGSLLHSEAITQFEQWLQQVMTQ